MAAIIRARLAWRWCRAIATRRGRPRPHSWSFDRRRSSPAWLVSASPLRRTDRWLEYRWLAPFQGRCQPPGQKLPPSCCRNCVGKSCLRNEQSSLETTTFPPRVHKCSAFLIVSSWHGSGVQESSAVVNRRPCCETSSGADKPLEGAGLQVCCSPAPSRLSPRVPTLARSHPFVSSR